MAERRMFAKTIIDSDAFLEMPMSARLLYYDLSMRADDDGFVNSPRKIMKFIGASSDDMNILIARKFVIGFDNGVVVIKHWRIHNYIRGDRYKETTYKEQMAQLELDENKAYRLTEKEIATNLQPTCNQLATDGLPTVDQVTYQRETQVRLGKDRLGKVNNSMRFTPPTIDEVKAYVAERGNRIDAQRFYDYYEAAGWKDSSGKSVKNWKQKAITWENHSPTTHKLPDFENPYKQEQREEPTMTPEEAKEWYDNLIKELQNEKN